ncbi:MAG: hypothetical protein WD993_10920 [Thermoleophilaceae bacterium]
MRTAPISLALALTILLAAPPPASEGRPLKAIWGPVALPDGTSAFPTYRHLGVDALQLQLRWSEVAPRRPRRPRNAADPAYRWPLELDLAIAQGRAHGIAVALLVRDSPAWANGGRPPQWAPRPAHYARFLTAASRRYPTVRRWMIWGEANRAAVFQPLPPGRRRGPRVYARLLDRAYVALKRRSPRNVVVGGMTFSFGEVLPAAWLRWMRLPGGRRPRLDEYGHNPFSRRPPRLRRRPYGSLPDARDISDMDTFAAEVRRAYRHHPRFRRRPGPRLWLSEFTVSSDRPNRAFDFAVSRRTQARWLRRAFRIAGEIGASGLGWFNLHDEPPRVDRGLTTGLMTHEGQRKPAYRAYRRVR